VHVDLFELLCFSVYFATDPNTECVCGDSDLILSVSIKTLVHTIKQFLILKKGMLFSFLGTDTVSKRYKATKS
jgi:hypothetical protein